MAMNFKRRLPLPIEIREEMSVSPAMAAKKPEFDASISNVITGADKDRYLLIIGPCSADRDFVVLPHGVTLSDSDKRKLRQEGILR